jgi:hypothetical protein
MERAMADQTFLAVVADCKDAISQVANAVGSTQPQLVQRVQQKLALLEQAGRELASAKDSPISSVEAGPIPHGLQVVKELQPLPNDGSTSQVFSTDWGTTGLCIGLRLGVKGIANLTEDLWIQAMQNLEIDIKFENGRGSLFTDGLDDAFVPMYQLVNESPGGIWRFTRPFSQKEAWTMKFKNATEGVDDVVPVVIFEFLDYNRVGA